MSKQTAVEWLVEQLPLIQQEGLRFIIAEAIAMEREQIQQTYSDGLGNGCHYERGEAAQSVLDEKQYYEQRYRKEASDEEHS